MAHVRLALSKTLLFEQSSAVSDGEEVCVIVGMYTLL